MLAVMFLPIGLLPFTHELFHMNYFTWTISHELFHLNYFTWTTSLELLKINYFNMSYLMSTTILYPMLNISLELLNYLTWATSLELSIEICKLNFSCSTSLPLYHLNFFTYTSPSKLLHLSYLLHIDLRSLIQ